jgi:hypothetical protein
MSSYNNYRENKIAKVKALVQQRGGWENVLATCQGLSQSMKKGLRQQPCPKTGDGITKFRWFKDWKETGGAYHNDVGCMPDGIDVYAWYCNMSKADALDEIIQICGGNIESISDREAKRATQRQHQRAESRLTPEEVTRNKAVLSRNKAKAVPISGTHAEAYLRNRGIRSDLSRLSDLGFTAKLAYREEGDTDWRHFPGMLAMVRNVEGKPVTMHRTFLDASQPAKANILRSKMIFAAIEDVRGCSIQLDQPVVVNESGEKLIGIAEGIENALSVREATGTPMWVGISDRLMEMVKLPDDVKYVLIWADIEPSGAGMAAAKRMKERLEKEGRQARIMTPETHGKEKVDWNDIYQDKGLEGFPMVLQPEFQVQTGMEIV